jgi:Mrp family chromosome partitioning ATPase
MSLVKMSSTSSLDTINSSDGGSDTETESDLPASPSKLRNPYKQLKSLLRLSSTADKASSNGIIGRDEEKDALKSYFSMRSDRDVGMYVSGPPGTGKTALVTAMGREAARQGSKVVEVGCMGLGVSDVWRRLGQALGCAGTEREVGIHMEQQGRDTYVPFVRIRGHD